MFYYLVNMLHKYEDDEEDLEALFNKAHPLSNFLNENEVLNRITSASKSKPGTGTRLGTSSGVISFFVK